jgi:NADPH-dependent curcumin reductase CurA
VSAAASGARPRHGREIHLVARPEGLPREEDFAVVTVDVPELRDDELLVRNTWMSLDPSMRIRMNERVLLPGSYLPRFELHRPIGGWAVGEVLASRSADHAVGDWVFHAYGWREYAVVSPRDTKASLEPIAVDAETPARTYLGALGWTAFTAYVGLLEAAELRAGDVVFISGAAGATGSMAVQIAKLRGHTVIGSAGTAAKVAHVRATLGADAAFCYRDGPVADALAALAPEGIDVYFDNVAGEHLEAALDALRPGGRVALCGAISTYNAATPPPGPMNLFAAVAKGLTLRGFLARMYDGRREEFRAAMRGWLREGRVVFPETVFEGLEAAPRGIRAVFAGENVGKTLVHLA